MLISNAPSLQHLEQIITFCLLVSVVIALFQGKNPWQDYS